MKPLNKIALTVSTLILSFFLLNYSLIAQSDTNKKRVIYWLYDDVSFWDIVPGKGKVPELNMQNYKTKFMQDFYTHGEIPIYDTDTSITGIGRRVQRIVNQTQSSFLNNPTFSLSPPIAIGHGLGGLVARSIEHENLNNNTQPFNGIITISTANYGSQLLKNMVNGELGILITRTLADLWAFKETADDWKGAFKATNEMLKKSPLAPDPKDRPNPDNVELDPFRTHIDTIPSIMRKAHGALINRVVQSFSEANHKLLFDDVTDNINQGSVFLTNLNNPHIPQSIPIINIISGGTNKPIYRFLASHLSPPWNSDLDKHNDTWLSTTIEIITSVYRYVGELLYTPTFFTMPWAPLLVDVEAGDLMVFGEFIKGAEALEKNFPEGVSALIGSVKKTTKKFYKVRRNFKIDLLGDALPHFIFEENEETIFTRTQPDDGFLSEVQQTNLKSLPEDNILILGTNNIGVMNNIKVRNKIDEILETKFGVVRKR
jgi:hypothetical protein